MNVTEKQQVPDHLSHRRPEHVGDDATRVHRLRCRRRLAERYISALCPTQPSPHLSSWEFSLLCPSWPLSPTGYQGGLSVNI